MIYFLQPTDGGPVKIGTTENLDLRRKQLESRYGCPLALLATVEGGPDEERAIHERFAHLRYGATEQFRPAAELMAFIGRPLLVSADPDAVEVMPHRSPPPGRPGDVPAKLERSVAGMAKQIAIARGIPLAEYLSGVLRDPVRRDFAKLLREFEGKGGPA